MGKKTGPDFETVFVKSLIAIIVYLVTTALIFIPNPSLTPEDYIIKPLQLLMSNLLALGWFVTLLLLVFGWVTLERK